MEWNSKFTTEWEWENTAIYGGGAIEMDRVLAENGSTYSSADLGIGSSSKSSISTYMYPSTKEETKNFDEIDNRLPKYYRGKEEYEHPGLDKICEFPVPGASSIVSGEPMIGLKLGGHSYFEEICASNTNKSVSLSVIPASSSSPSTKRARASYQCTQTPRCQVEGCNLDLTLAKDYYRRHRICDSHSKCPRVIVAGLERRFCQQCSRLHDLSKFDEKKRSCRKRLSDHNARRRRQQPEVIQFGSTLLSSLYDQRPEMNFLLNGFPIQVSNQIWERCSGGRVSGDSLVGHLNGGEFDRRLNSHNTSMPNAFPLPPRVLNHGAETSAISTTTTNGGAPPKELHRALSLLSTDSRPLNNSQQFTSLHHHQLLAPEFNSHLLMHSDPPNFPLSSTDLHNNAVNSSNSTQFQEFQLFYSNHIN